MIVAFAGGVGGAKLAFGLYQEVPLGELAVIVNTGDDLEMYGLHISPDLDTVMYSLAGIANHITGWGIEGDTFYALKALARYGEESWFGLGDQDLATHILRTKMLGEGQSLTAVTRSLAARLGVKASLLPMCDQRVATVVETPDGPLPFQDYFVRRGASDRVLGLRFEGVERAKPTPEVERALSTAELIVFAPSNPFLSIQPILAVPGLRGLLSKCPAPKVAVSPVIGGRAVRGPADRLLRDLGHEVSTFGVAKIYAGLVSCFVIDEVDRQEAPRIEALGLRVLVTKTLMNSAEDKKELARRTIRFALGKE
jgi:LPPG:FO 2-phospho-L-lactate transferase